MSLKLVAEVARVIAVLPLVEIERRRLSLHEVVAIARRRARARATRSPAARTTLQRVIASVDARVPGGPNCVRRSLIEMTLDRGAARERLLAGFTTGGGVGSGHAWLASTPAPKKYDAVITI